MLACTNILLRIKNKNNYTCTEAQGHSLNYKDSTLQQIISTSCYFADHVCKQKIPHSNLPGHCVVKKK